jgi:hypothetical protein
VSDQLHAPTATTTDINLCTHSIRGLVDPRVSLEVVVKEYSLPALGNEPLPSSPQPAIIFTGLRFHAWKIGYKEELNAKMNVK